MIPRSIVYLAACSKFSFLRKLAWRWINPKAEHFSLPDSAIKILVGGDVCFDREFRSISFHGVYRQKEQPLNATIGNRIKRKIRNFLYSRLLERDLFTCHHLNFPFQELLMKNAGNEDCQKVEDYYLRAIPLLRDECPSNASFDYPFYRLGDFLRSKDLVVVNLETPLAENRRVQGGV